MEAKKNIIIEILRILQKHTDENHTLSQHRIQKLLESEYGRKVDIKTVKRNLSKLIELEFPIEYSDGKNGEIHRVNKYGNQETIQTNWYYRHDFSDGELLLLISNILFTSALPKRVRNELIAKLKGLSNQYFRSKMSRVDTDVYNRIENYDIINTIELGNMAIANDKQLRFHYCECGTNLTLKYKLDSDGLPKIYIVTPYQFISANGHTYLICHMPSHDGLTHFRLDRIKDAEIIDLPAKRLREIKGFEAGIKLSDYLAEHSNLWSGTAVYITFRCPKYLMNDIVDSFGTNVRIETKSDDDMIVHVRAGEESMKKWAIQFSDAVEVLTPVSLRKQIAEELRNALKKYEN